MLQPSYRTSPPCCQLHGQSRLPAILRAVAPVAVCVIGSFWITGCDTASNQTDRKVQADVAQAQASLATQNDQSIAQAAKQLETASAVSDISPETKAYAKNALGQVEQNAATATMRQIDEDDRRLHRLLWEIGQLAGEIDASHALAGSYDKLDPKPAHDAIAAAIAAAQNGPATPNLAAVAQSISQLQSQISKQQDDLKTLQDQRTQILTEANEADKSSELSKGQQSVDDFKRAADLRKQAGDLAVQIDKNKAQTIPLQQDLAVAQGQQTLLQETVQRLQDQSALLDSGWKSIQDAVASQATLQQQIAAGSGDSTPAPAPAPAPTADATGGPAGTSMLSATAGQSLNAKADALAKLVQQIGAERTDALASLNNAIHHYGDAISAAKQYYADLDLKIRDPANATRPEHNGRKTLQATINPAAYEMQQALAQRQLADLYVSQIVNDNDRALLQEQVGKILTAANIAVPAGISDNGLDEDKKAAADAAASAYQAADQLLGTVGSGMVPEPYKKLSHVQQVLTSYGELRLARLTGDSATAQTKLTDTTTARDLAIQEGDQLPPLPDEIAPPPTPAAPGSSAAPKT